MVGRRWNVLTPEKRADRRFILRVKPETKKKPRNLRFVRKHIGDRIRRFQERQIRKIYQEMGDRELKKSYQKNALIHYTKVNHRLTEAMASNFNECCTREDILDVLSGSALESVL